MKIFGRKYVGQTLFGSKNILRFGPKKFQVRKMFDSQSLFGKNFLSKKLYVQKILGSKKCWAKNNFGSKKFLFSKNFEQISWSKKTPYLIRPIDLIQLDTRCFLKLT